MSNPEAFVVAASSVTPSPWVSRFSALIRPGGTVLDLACGNGRHSRYLAAQGFLGEAVDLNGEALAELSGQSGISTRQADLEGGPWPYYNRCFDAVVVTNFLFRPLLPQIFNVIDIGGVLIYETFMAGNELLGKPANPAHLLRRGELLELVRNRFTVVAFEQGRVETPRPAVIQRICVVREMASRLPLSSPAT